MFCPWIVPGFEYGIGMMGVLVYLGRNNVKNPVIVWFLLVLAGFVYSVFDPTYLIRLTAWNNRLVGWNWPTTNDEDRRLFRLLAAVGATLFAVGIYLLISDTAD